MTKGKLNSIINNKCPRCNEGDFWKIKNPYLNIFFNKGDNNKNCSICKLIYEIEPGFFFGAMYVSYALGIGIGVFIFLFLFTLLKIKSLGIVVSLVCLVVLFFAPVNYYLSRLIYINLFIEYNKKKLE